MSLDESSWLYECTLNIFERTLLIFKDMMRLSWVLCVQVTICLLRVTNSLLNVTYKFVTRNKPICYIPKYPMNPHNFALSK